MCANEITVFVCMEMLSAQFKDYFKNSIDVVGVRWMHDATVLDRLTFLVSENRCAGIGEFHAVGYDKELPVVQGVFELNVSRINTLLFKIKKYQSTQKPDQSLEKTPNRANSTSLYQQQGILRRCSALWKWLLFGCHCFIQMVQYFFDH